MDPINSVIGEPGSKEMKYNEITYPVNLGRWEFGSNSEWVGAYYYEWNDGNPPGPASGGFAFIVWNNQDNPGSTPMNIWWVAPYMFALETADTHVFAAIATGAYASTLSLSDGPQNLQQPFTSIQPNGTFQLRNLGQGNFAIFFEGMYLSVNNTGWTPDWHFNSICPSLGGVGQYETFQISGVPSCFRILLITGSGLGLNLTGQDLSQGGYIQSVCETDFTQANLTNANLSKLPNLSVYQCNFTGATLTGAILTGVRDLSKVTSWTSAVLAGTDLSQVDPDGVRGIDFSSTLMQGAILSNGKPLPQNYDYHRANFSSTHLEKAVMNQVSFVGANFTTAHMQGADLSGADLTGAILIGADLTGATLAGTIFRGAQLAGTVFDGCDLTAAVFDEQPLFGTSVDERTSFQNATVPATSLGMNWSYIDLTGATLIDVPADLSSLVAEYTLFPDEAPLAGIKLLGANLSNAQMFYAQLTKSDLAGATLTNTLLKGAKLTGANLSNATMQGAWLIAQDSGDDPNMYEAAQAEGAFLLNTVMDQVQAAGVDFTGASFVSTVDGNVQASAQGAFMVHVIFSGALVVGVNLRGTQLAGGNFYKAKLVGSTLSSCKLIPTSDTGHTVPIVNSADLRGTLFADQAGNVITNPANMDGLDMNGACVSTTGGVYSPQTYTDYYGQTIQIYVDYGATVLGTTTSNTTCPNGQPGVCTLEGGGTDCSSK